jgi:hypothetical protein
MFESARVCVKSQVILRRCGDATSKAYALCRVTKGVDSWSWVEDYKLNRRMKMKAGSRIRLQRYMMGIATDTDDFTVEEFRHCLGIFESNDRRKAGNFTPLCDLYYRGPDSKDDYISNYGEYVTNMVPAWMDIPN